MTIKELAAFTGKTERTIQMWVKKTGEKNSSVGEKISSAGHGKGADFTIDEVEQILLNSSLSKDAVSILMENARKKEVTTETVLSERDVALISRIVAATVVETMKQLDGRMTNIEQRIEERKALLPPPEIDIKSRINMLVRDYAVKKHMEYRRVWQLLYRQYGYTTNSNPVISAKNREMKIIDYLEVEGQLDVLESIAVNLFSK